MKVRIKRTPNQNKSSKNLNAAKWHHKADGGDLQSQLNKPLTDEQYFKMMERVANKNYADWGYDSPEAALLHALNDNTYNYRQFYNDNPTATNNAQTHWPDTYKTVYHPTFSSESMYSGVRDRNFNPEGRIGGIWSGDTFYPNYWQTQYRNGGDTKKKKSTASNGMVANFKEEVMPTKPVMDALVSNYYSDIRPYMINSAKQSALDAAKSNYVDDALNTIISGYWNNMNKTNQNNMTSGIMSNYLDDVRRGLYRNGGELNTMDDINNGFIDIVNGGTHEENPFGGVPVNIAEDGLPNLVEEGEIIYNGYVYSNNLRPSKEAKQRLGLKGSTYADVIRKAQKYSSERPDDPVAKEYDKYIATTLAVEQEQQKANQDMNKTNKKGIRGHYAKYGDNIYSAFKDIFNPYLTGLNINYGNTLPEVTVYDNPTKSTTVPKATIPVTTNTDTPENKGHENWFNANAYRAMYAPVAANFGQLVSDWIGNTNTYSTERADAFRRNVGSLAAPTMIGYNSVGQHLNYNPMDSDYLANKAANQIAANRSILRYASPTGAALQRNLMGLNYTGTASLADALMKNKQYNDSLKKEVVGFNNALDLQNASNKLSVAQANAQAMNRYKEALADRNFNIARALDAIQTEEDTAISNARDTNRKAAWDSVGEAGKQFAIFRMIQNDPSLLYSWLNDFSVDYKGKPSKNGGRLKCGGSIRRRK